jgi:hypothetical protein
MSNIEPKQLSLIPTDNGTDQPYLIGNSLSACVRDLLDWRVSEKQVVRITTGTHAASRLAFVEILDLYVGEEWNNRREGKEIALRLWDAGKIDQPRTRNEAAPPTHHIHWKNVTTGEPVVFNKVIPAARTPAVMPCTPG